MASRPVERPLETRATGVACREQYIELVAFSINLAVKDLAASSASHEKSGFRAFAGEPSQTWLIMKNGDHAIGLFQGMFERNILTFNPGGDSNAQELATFTDVRELQRQLKAQGAPLVIEADDSTTGRASSPWIRTATRCSSISTSELTRPGCARRRDWRPL